MGTRRSACTTVHLLILLSFKPLGKPLFNIGLESSVCTTVQLLILFIFTSVQVLNKGTGRLVCITLTPLLLFSFNHCASLQHGNWEIGVYHCDSMFSDSRDSAWVKLGK